MIDRDLKGRLLDLIDDLYWEEERMSSSGVEALNKLEVIIDSL